MTTLNISKLNESYMRIECDDLGVLQDLNDFFSFFMPGAQYSPKYKAGIWDGKIRIFNYAQRKLYIGLLEYVEAFAKSNDIEINFEDKIKINNKLSPQKIADFIDSLELSAGGKPIKPRTHQYYGVYHVLNFQRALLLSPTSSGKSLIIYILARFMAKYNYRFLIIVPNIGLVTQLYSDFEDYSGLNNWNVEENVHTISGGKDKNTDKPIVISTWQSIYKLPITWFSSFNGINYDEAHLAKGQSLQGIADKVTNAQYRVGLTGTLDGTKANELVIQGVTGPVKSLITTKQLIDKGEIANLFISVQMLKYNPDICKGAGRLDYQQEVKAIASYKKRNKTLVKIVADNNKNSLILFNEITHGKELLSLVNEMYPDRKTYYIDGDVSKEEREHIRQSVEKDSNAIIVGSYGTISTGISIKNLHIIAFASSSKSKIRVLQSIGRGLRLHKSKDKMILLDFVDDMAHKKKKNYVLKHFLERIEIYNKSQFEYEIVHTNLF